MLFLFYFFAFVVFGSATMVVASRDPIHSVLFLVATFIGSSSLFILIGAEFIGLLLLVIYVGAVIILFLFVVMMLDIDIISKKAKISSNWPIIMLIMALLGADLFLFINKERLNSNIFNNISAERIINNKSNIIEFSSAFYSNINNLYNLEVIGMLLLLGMIGSIFLVLRNKRKGLKRQSDLMQKLRNRSSVELVKVNFKEGIK
ncbi:MAG: NADH-quinone oxidoreductase subunit J [Anaplasmataceae bacterium]|nr:NADH-quinone oxidoreductase subunit J [Anaplasmataceae bacterium]